MADKEHELARVRQRIEALDRELVTRLGERARLSKELRSLLEGSPHTVDVDEASWVGALLAASSGDMPAAGLRRILSELRATVRGLERPQAVAYVGPEGGFCHQVTQGYFGQSECTEYPSVAEVLDAVVRGRAGYSVFPFESSIDGLVQSSVTALAGTDLVMVAERTRPVAYDLMNRTGNGGDMEKIYLTPAAHAECQRYLERERQRVPLIDVRSPAMAAQFAADDHGAAAIVPGDCGRAHGLEVVMSNIGDEPSLAMRYCIAGARPASRTGHDTTCLLVGLNDAPGSLFEILRHFAERGISIHKMQSRPQQGKGRDYDFYMEVTGHVSDRPVLTALEAARRSTNYLRVLGSFPHE